MIERIEGVLEGIENGAALVRIGEGLTYQVLVSAYAAGRLSGSIGKVIRLYTFHFIESQNQGASMIPRLAGFMSAEDRRFYELFTTVKGIGNKRALRSMALDCGRIAAAIADRDSALLQSLPEIGKRTAETIIATLSGKVDAFVSAAAFSTGGRAAESGAGENSGAMPGAAAAIAREAMEALMQLGENRTQVVLWIDQAMREKDRPRDVAALIQRVYQLKAGA